MSNNPQQQPTEQSADTEPMVSTTENDNNHDEQGQEQGQEQEQLSIDQDPEPEPDPETESEGDAPPHDTADVELQYEEQPDEERELPPEVQNALDEYYEERRQIEEEGVPEEEFLDEKAKQQHSGSSSGSGPSQSTGGGSTGNIASGSSAGGDGEGDGVDPSDIGLDGAESLEEIDVEKLEEQEWTLGEGRPPKIESFNGMDFLFTDLEDETKIMDLSGERDQTEAFYRLVTEVVEAPSINRYRWRNEMTATERMGLVGRVMAYLDAGQLGNSA